MALRNPLVFLIVVLGTFNPATAQLIDSLKIMGTGFDVDVSGNLFVIDGGSNLVTTYPPDRETVAKQFGGQGWGNEQFDRPFSIWARNGLDIFVADYGNHRIQRYDRTLSYVSTLFTRDDADPAKRFGYPTDMALSRLGDLFICDSENGRILKVSRTTQPDRSFGGFDAGRGRLYAPAQVEIGASDKVYVLDRGRIVVFDVFGNYLRELLPGVIVAPSVVYADPERVLVVDRDTVYHFDEHDRPLSALNVREVAGGRFSGGDIRSIGYSRGRLYALTSQGMFILRLSVETGMH